MQLRAAGIGLLVLLGVGLVGYGFAVGDEGRVEIEVLEQVDESDLETEYPMTEYDYLTPKQQDAFRQSLQTGDSVSVDEEPEFTGGYVHYRESYYRVGEANADASNTTMFFSIAAGMLLIGLGILGWYYFD
jgi:hypothetical protein